MWFIASMQVVLDLLELDIGEYNLGQTSLYDEMVSLAAEFDGLVTDIDGDGKGRNVADKWRLGQIRVDKSLWLS